MDEIFTPDSSRLWYKQGYTPGTSPESIDKQILRDYLDNIGWDRKPPTPTLPDDITVALRDGYLQAYQAILGHPLTD
jgi:phosphoribosylaminoimidazole-succinocarboxamide synthase